MKRKKHRTPQTQTEIPKKKNPRRCGGPEFRGSGVQEFRGCGVEGWTAPMFRQHGGPQLSSSEIEAWRSSDFRSSKRAGLTG